MTYSINSYTSLKSIGKITEDSINLHLKLYEGYVNNTNTILSTIKAAVPNSPEWNELNRRLGWEWNGMRNHELFFESLSSSVTETPVEFLNYIKELEIVCKMRGIGWGMLVQDKRTKELLVIWVNEHDVGMLSDVNIILNIDMFEHAYILDFGTNRQEYLNSVFSHINWDVVTSRLIK